MPESIMPADVAAPAANYAHACLSRSGSRWLHTSGVVPVAADGTVPGGIADQAEVIWRNIIAMLRDAEMTPAQIASVTTYVTPGQDLAEIMAVRDRVLDGHLAASTLVIVAELARPEWLMEIAVIAADEADD